MNICIFNSFNYKLIRINYELLRFIKKYIKENLRINDLHIKK